MFEKVSCLNSRIVIINIVQITVLKSVDFNGHEMFYLHIYICNRFRSTRAQNKAVLDNDKVKKW